jgi:hypothetical protein
MSEHEPSDVADRDKLAGRDEPRAARSESRMPPADDTPAHKGRQEHGVRATGSDDAQVASEPMDLQRLPDDGCAPAPPGRRRTGDPPAKQG